MTEDPQNDSQPTDCAGETASTSRERWERVGREALSYQLEQFSTEVQEAFGEADRKVRAGEDLTRGDLSEMRHAMELAGHAMDLVEQLVEGDRQEHRNQKD